MDNNQHQTIDCPCCGDEMDAVNVVCWCCYRMSNRLTPGTYPEFLTTLTTADIARYDAERNARLAL